MPEHPLPPASDGGPLAGVKVVESSSFLTGPYTATMLADMGASVIKVEAPGGDGFRGFGHRRHGFSALWSSANRGKRSIELDLKNADDLATMKALLAEADVLVENWRPQVAGRLGLGQDVVAALNPRLVRLSITGFGATGPLAAAPAYDSLIQARTGMLALFPEGEEPQVAPYWVVDKVVSTFGAQAIVAALFQRERTGRGSQVSLPMLDVMTYFNFPDMFQHRTFADDDTPWTPAFNPVVKTADGHIVVTPVSGAQISGTIRALNRPDIKEELLTIKNPVKLAKRFYERIAEVMITQPSAHWIALLAQADMPVAPVQSLDEHLADPQVANNRLYHEVPLGDARLRAVRYPAAFDGRMFAPAGAPPRVGEHTGQIRAELGGHHHGAGAKE